MRVIFLFVVISFLISCASYKYTYKISMQNPVKSERLYYENDTLSLAFDFNTKGLQFDLYNKSDDGIRINWDEVSISENGIAKRIVHRETGMTKINDLQPPTTIPPKTKLEDFVVSSDNIRFANLSGRLSMVVKDIYPTYDYGNKQTRTQILRLKGQRVTLFLPYYMKNVYCSKVFDFYIEDIISKKN